MEKKTKDPRTTEVPAPHADYPSAMMENSTSEPPRIKQSRNKNQIINILENENKQGILQSFGTTNRELVKHLSVQVCEILPKGASEIEVNAAMAAMHGIHPQTPLEGLLVVQMIGAHNLAMEFLRRSILPGQTIEGTESNLNRANKLLRTFAMQMETLQKCRNRGHQQVTVQYVHVNGQAIVGTVNQSEEGGRRGPDGES